MKNNDEKERDAICRRKRLMDEIMRTISDFSDSEIKELIAEIECLRQNRESAEVRLR